MKKVIVVDDAVTVRMYHRKLMEDIGFEVDEAENGLEALERALQTPYALCLVDVNMPKMDGYRFVEELRSHPDLMAVPVIMISTEESERDREKAYMIGANYYVVKPVKGEELQACAVLLAGGVA